MLLEGRSVAADQAGDGRRLLPELDPAALQPLRLRVESVLELRDTEIIVDRNPAMWLSARARPDDKYCAEEFDDSPAKFKPRVHPLERAGLVKAIPGGRGVF